MKGLQPIQGLLTFEAEGQEGGPFHSRVLHVPSMHSGLTLGRGYDCKTKTATKVEADFSFAGIDKANARLIAKGAGLVGDAAKRFIDKSQLRKFEISYQQQLKLFDLVYREEFLETKRLCTKADVENEYGSCDWDNLHPAIKEVLVDLKFRGDYTPRTRRYIQQHVTDNDLHRFYEAMTDRKNWPTVPLDRFTRRVEYLKRRIAAFAIE